MKYVHIAGTNGKGSVTETIYRILMAAGKRTGCFTSPHLVSATERMRVNERAVSERELAALLDEVRLKGLAVNDTIFAAYTVAALLWFEREDVEYAVLETGLGGRCDPTNTVTACVSVLTPIDYDHMAILGNTMTQIAYEKSGIIKPGVPVICAVQHDEAAAVITQTCQKKGAPLTVVPPVSLVAADKNGQSFDMEGQRYWIRSIGRHQPNNAALAVKAAQTLGIGEAAIQKGLRDTVLRCRTQLVPGNPDVLLDGAHNAAAVEALCGVLRDYFSHRDKVLLFACMKDKDYPPMIRKLAPLFSHVTVTSVNERRGEDAAILSQMFSAITRSDIQYDPVEAYQTEKRRAADTDAMLVVCGSFYLAGLIELLVVCSM